MWPDWMCGFQSERCSDHVEPLRTLAAWVKFVFFIYIMKKKECYYLFILHGISSVSHRGDGGGRGGVSG